MQQKWNMIIDVAECTNCQLCTLAAMDEYVGNDWPGYAAPMPRHGHKWINILQKERGQVPMVDVAYVPTMCNHCDDAPCVAKGGGAVTKRADGIVLIDRVNNLRLGGMPRNEAIIEGGRDRLRPILMTVATTVVGLLPLAISTTQVGGDGPPYFPMARAIIGGLLFSTIVSLLVVPAFYALLARYTHSPEALAHELDTLESSTPEAGGHA